ncbi:MAG: hypothetical protein C4278_02245 [Patescibacteria group bacterium]
MKRKNNQNNFKKIIIEKIKSENFKLFLGWLFVILSFFILVSILSPKGTVTDNLFHLLYKFYGWTIYILPFFVAYFAYLFFQKHSWFKYLKYFLGLSLLFLLFNFYIHFLFREGGYLGRFIFNFNQLIGDLGSILLSFPLFLMSLWLIFEDKFLEFIKNIFTQTQKIVEEVNKKEKISTPFKGVKQEIKIETPKEKIKTPTKANLIFRRIIQKSKWELPSIDLLKQGKEEVVAPDINKTSEIIKKTLNNFGIQGEIVDVEIGPAVTRFSLKPGEGIKLSKILSLQNDIALALGIPNIYLETPVPGKAVIGIEIPNIKSAVVKLGNFLNTEEFLNSDELLLFPLGRKINGEPMFADLAKMPHLLIAGTTGSGKSIFIHNIIISFLMKNTPETLNFILVDPKRVELIHYQNIPHLLLDPVVDLKKALTVFNWLVNEMEERYKLLEANGSRDIDSYNRRQIQKKEKILPRIVLIIDEMADLMVSYGSSIESLIIRLTQMARATGIHLVLATQRPSVDIVTGLIKANIPNRICFKVASQVDSRTVLDMAGAEKLIGSGDGLFISTTLHKPVRIKSPFVSEEEIDSIVDFWLKQMGKLQETEIPKISFEDLEKKFEAVSTDETDEELFKQAVYIVVEAQKASTSLLQRRLKIGYARAARILDLMEEKGIVGPQEGSKPRRVLITIEELKNIFPEEK